MREGQIGVLSSSHVAEVTRSMGFICSVFCISIE